MDTRSQQHHLLLAFAFLRIVAKAKLDGHE